MEEILASIRRIISEDDQPGATAAAGSPEAEAEEESGGDVLELTQKVEPPPSPPAPESSAPPSAAPAPAQQPAETVGDLDVFAGSSSPSVRTPQPPTSQESRSGAPMRDQPLASDDATLAAASRLNALEQVQLERGVVMPSGQTMDAVVRDLLNPMLKVWLDQNLESIVEAKVQAEIERISRRR